jgi:hypothetical protein
VRPVIARREVMASAGILALSAFPVQAVAAPDEKRMMDACELSTRIMLECLIKRDYARLSNNIDPVSFDFGVDITSTDMKSSQKALADMRAWREQFGDVYHVATYSPQVGLTISYGEAHWTDAEKSTGPISAYPRALLFAARSKVQNAAKASVATPFALRVYEGF